MFGSSKMNCIACGEISELLFLRDGLHRIYICPTCGTYIYYDGMNVFEWLDFSEKKGYLNFPSYLYYHHIDLDTHVKKERNYIGDEKALKYHLETEQSNTEHIKYNLVTDDIVKEFIPEKFQEKEKLFLKDIYQKRNIVTDIVDYTINQIESAAFVIRQKDFADNYMQFSKILNDLQENKLIEVLHNGLSNDFVRIKITTKGIKLIEEGEIKMAESKNVTINNNGVMINQSTISDSRIENKPKINDIDYEALKTLIQKIEENYKNEKEFSNSQLSEISQNLEEIKVAIEEKNQSKILKCLNSIATLAYNVGSGLIANGIFSMIQQFMRTLPGM